MAERQNTGAVRLGKRFVRFGTPGRADISGVWPDGRRLEIEVKRPGNKPTQAQLDFLLLMQEQGAIAFWVDDVAKLDAILLHLKRDGRVVTTPEGKVTLL